MGNLKSKAIFLIMIVALLIPHDLCASDDDFNEFAALIYKKDLKGIKELLAKGVDVNLRHETMGTTPLIVACSLEGTYEIVEFLISKGADIHIIGSYDGRTALHWASANSKKTVELLLDKGAKVDVKGVDGMTAFIQSIFGILSGSVNTDVCDLLIRKGANVNDQLSGPDATGWSPLLFACSNGNLDLTKYLLSEGADVNLKAKDGTSALSLAMGEKNDEIIRILKEKGAQ